MLSNPAEAPSSYVLMRMFGIFNKMLFMNTRKHNIVRNILRVFEIALFFAVSVFGYGLLVKTTSVSSSKSKSRNQPPGIQRDLGLNGMQRELRVMPETLRQPVKPELTLRKRALLLHLSGSDHAHAAYAFQPHLQPLLPYQYHRYYSTHIPFSLPYNLLQENPVLLI